MRRLVVAIVLLAGCASTSDYVPGPPTTVREPSFSGQVRPRQPAYSRDVATSGLAETPPQNRATPAAPIVPDNRPAAPISGGFMEWLRSGRGWTWGAARRGPVRDEGLDRLMVDTLISGQPGYTSDPASRSAPLAVEPWLYPPASPTNERP